METTSARAWLLFELLLRLSAPPVSFSLPAVPVQTVVSSRVGADVQLPCPCPALAPVPEPHVQWCLETTGPILEQRGQQRWVSDEVSDRAQVPESGPGTGDCTLLLSDLQVTDRGRYHGYMIQDSDQSQTRTGLFICSVKLLVFEHSSVESKIPGEDLVFDLHTTHAMSLVFQDSNGSEWRSLWRRGGPASARVEKDPQGERLRLRAVCVSDEGVYKVLDANGLTVASTRLSLTTPHDKSTALKFTQDELLLLRAGSVSPASCGVLFVAAAALTSLLLLLDR